MTERAAVERKWVCKCGSKNRVALCRCGLRIEIQGNGWRYTNLDMRTGRANKEQRALGEDQKR